MKFVRGCVLVGISFIIYSVITELFVEMGILQLELLGITGVLCWLGGYSFGAGHWKNNYNYYITQLKTVFLRTEDYK